ncbi:cytochrome c [Rhodoferax mekongensis]|uniref:Cytochrome c n=1 Tax=Rhodoferax mekongensis TaxID=3068341 RepID=A0ABZ0B3I3_9BURK|nr:cytochrome c [Rhodoferax sp. TBRC 17307]WNO06398.1 cytochrome c [Rhodoferax sp. TBRC 17307]
MKKIFAGLFAAALLFVVVAEWVAPAVRKSTPSPQALPAIQDATQVQRGAYLARLGNCAQCHTARGGQAYAGGDGLQTPFGRVYPGNLTPHPTAGIGQWSEGDFWRAMHQGVGPHGRVLNPAFPYTSFTRVSRADSDALFAYLRTLPAADTKNKSHELPWPLGTQTALTAWRILHFSEAETTTIARVDAPPSARRGSELVQGLGHCAECHTPRNRLGGLRTSAAWNGATLPDGRWYAPALNDPSEAGLSNWDAADIVTLLTRGQHQQAYVAGPMADVVRNSTQYLEPGDALSMALYLQTLSKGAAAPKPAPASVRENALGAKLYENQCAQCHGKRGEGVENAYPALAGNRAVLMDNTNNLVLILLKGAYGPSTTGKPQPFGMPPYQFALNDVEMANVLSFIRNSWGNHALPVTEFDINKIRNAPDR